MLPLFKSHYSIGKSILTLSDPSSVKEGGSDSIIDLCLNNNIKQLILVEDSPTGFFKAYHQCKKHELDLIFGIRLKVSSFDSAEKDDQSIHKCIVFAKNSDGIKLINKIYSDFYCNNNGVGNYSILKSYWDNDKLIFANPFYDSFLYCNSFFFSNCAPDFSFCKPIFFSEYNALPSDLILKDKIESYCSNNNYSFFDSKSIYYNLRSDLEAFQTYKCLCNRSFGKKKTLSNPGLEGFGSFEFCMESFLEHSKNEESLSI
jgi:hypothetical protein